jgi:hypothetical protein
MATGFGFRDLKKISGQRIAREEVGAFPERIGPGDWSVKEDAVQNKGRVTLLRCQAPGTLPRSLDNRAHSGKLAFVMDVAAFKEQLNLFLHRQNIRKLTTAECTLAREWCMDLIRREHAEWSSEQAERFYDNLINVRVVAVDEWTRRLE